MSNSRPTSSLLRDIYSGHPPTLFKLKNREEFEGGLHEKGKEKGGKEEKRKEKKKKEKKKKEKKKKEKKKKGKKVKRGWRETKNG